MPDLGSVPKRQVLTIPILQMVKQRLSNLHKGIGFELRTFPIMPSSPWAGPEGCPGALRPDRRHPLRYHIPMLPRLCRGRSPWEAHTQPTGGGGPSLTYLLDAFLLGPSRSCLRPR